MRRTVLFFVLAGLPALLTAQLTWTGIGSDQPTGPVVRVEKQDAQGAILTFDFAGFFESQVIEDGEVFQRLQVLENRTSKDIGKPELPMVSELVGIPGHLGARIKSVETETVTLAGYHVYPFQTPTVDIPGGHVTRFVINRSFYTRDQFYPSESVTLEKPGIWRDVKVAGLHLVPFRHNPVTGELVFITRFRIEIDFVQDPTLPVLSRSQALTPSFYRMYESAVVNFSHLGYSMTFTASDDIKYLVITNTNPLSSIQPLVDWKYRQGFRVEVKTMESGFSTPQEFKDYIKDLYDNEGLEYVLMVGDAYPNGGNGGGPDDVPMYWWAPSGEDPSYSDSWYTCMDGPDDHYADLAIGRFTYDNLTELELQIQKTLDHYLNPDDATNWAENSILIAHKEDYPGKYTQCCEEIRTFPYALQIPIFEPAYGGAGYSNQQVVDYVNANSCGILNYRGHGSATEFWQWCNYGSFTATHVAQLTNANRLFVVFDVCCDNMDIVAYNGNCLCETFMKSPVASVAINGAIIPSYTIPNHDYDKELYKGVFNEGIYNIGYVSNFANVTVLNNHGTIGRSNVRTYLWLGDASLEPWTLQPAPLTVTHDPQLFLGVSTFDVTVLGGGNPLENARVCVSNDDGTVYGVAFSNAAGLAQVVFDAPVQNPGAAKVTVTAHNCLAYQGDVQVIPQTGPYVIKDSFTLNDVAGGNGDGLMDYGESILMTLNMKNVGVVQANNVTVTISSADPYITITDNSEVYGVIGPNQVIGVTDGFAFEVANDLPDGHFIMIDVTATGTGDETWNSSFTIEGHAPVLEMGDFVINDQAGNNNGKVDPGETVTLIITVMNTGSSEAFNVAAQLSEADPFITINQGQASYGDIPGGSSAPGSFSITADISTPAGHVVDLDLEMTADMDITASATFNIVVGQIPVVIIDLDPNHSSGTVMEPTIQNLGVAVEYSTSIPADLNMYSSAFVCLGIYASNHVLTGAEGQTLADYLNNGGSLYMEGGDTWYYNSPTPVHTMFNINATGDGSSDMGTILGQTGTFTEGMTFTYNGENNWMDHIEPVSPAFKILQNQSPAYGTGVAYDPGTYKTIGTSHEFGGLTDGASPSTKEELMKEYLIFFGVFYNELTANFAASATTICEGESVDFTDFSTGPVSSWNWTFEGGTPASSTQQNPTVTYNTPGVFDVMLIISDGTSYDTLMKPDYMLVLEMPGTPGKPQGDEMVCTNTTTQTQYTTSGASGAISYAWEIEPAAAGTISGNTVTGTVTWTPNWEGTALVRVKGINTVCEGPFSDDLQVTCMICTGTDESLAEEFSVSPNPSDGIFNLSWGTTAGSIQVVVYNVVNKPVYSVTRETRPGDGWTLDLSDQPSGIYFLRISSGGNEMIRKLVVR